MLWSHALEPCFGAMHDSLLIELQQLLAVGVAYVKEHQTPADMQVRLQATTAL